MSAIRQPDRIPTGGSMDYWGATAPTGWLILNGLTIGNAASSATSRANADTEALFLLLWSSMADEQAAVTGGRGATAAEDFAANKAIALPDCRERVTAGVGTALGSINSSILGVTGGSPEATLSAGNIPQHTHGLYEAVLVDNDQENSTMEVTSTTGDSGNTGINADGTAEPVPTVQPTIIANKIIKL